jgi:hypothetical protein
MGAGKDNVKGPVPVTVKAVVDLEVTNKDEPIADQLLRSVEVPAVGGANIHT